MTTPDQPLSDDDMTTSGSGSTPPVGDADGTDSLGADTDGTDGDATDTTDGDASDSDGTDSDGGPERTMYRATGEGTHELARWAGEIAPPAPFVTNEIFSFARARLTSSIKY